MTSNNIDIVTIGISPAWDTFCRVDGIAWGQHKEIARSATHPAGKALNISRSLAWMGIGSTAAGLWGKDDYQEMLAQVAGIKKHITFKFTLAAGRTRNNINIIDTAHSREMHLRCPNELVNSRSLNQLQRALKSLVGKNTICIFSGSLPGGKLLDIVLDIITDCLDSGARVVIDTSGRPLRRITTLSNLWLIKPNVQELGQLVGRTLRNDPVSLVKAARLVLSRVENVLISRGEKGAILVNSQGRWQGRLATKQSKLAPKQGSPGSTVGCGDYLLAGFIGEYIRRQDFADSLKAAIIAGTARAWGLDEKYSWKQLRKIIRVEVKNIT